MCSFRNRETKPPQKDAKWLLEIRWMFTLHSCFQELPVIISKVEIYTKEANGIGENNFIHSAYSGFKLLNDCV